jgi:IS605 OrfB family transposase
MRQVTTAKLKLMTTPEQYSLLRQTQLAYRDALNYVSRYAFAHGKMSNAERLQQGTYDDIRLQFNLPSQMACNVPRQVGATYKGLWTKLRKNIEHHRAKVTKKRFKGLDKPPKYISPTVTYSYKHDYGFKPGQQVSVRTLQGRMVVPYQGYDRRMVATSGRERRLKLQTNHSIAKNIVEAHPSTLIGLEELMGIRERTHRRKRRRKGKKLVPVSPKARRANRHASRWAFAELHSLIAHKAALAGSLAIKVDADYTSQACPMCGYKDKKNRPRNGLLFICQNKQCRYRLRTEGPYTLHAFPGWRGTPNCGGAQTQDPCRR